MGAMIYQFPNKALEREQYAALIDELRDKRPFTENAVEMRCISLKLVIYVTPVKDTPFDTFGDPKLFRVVSYYGNLMRPSSNYVAKAGNDVFEAMRAAMAGARSMNGSYGRNQLISSNPSLIPNLCG